ncbi:aspartic peptidase domain-containing protein [Xylariaceae sp. FL1272]|nr:aspartic peptidase domain-containing protein [Xylariaceae sp. FL1272]
MSHLVSRALLSTLVFALATAVPVEVNHLLQTQRHAAKAGLAITDNFHPLTRIRREPGTPRTLDVLRQKYRKIHRNNANPEDDPIGSDHIIAQQNQIEYIMQVGIGNETYYMIPDTGSSDTWIIQEGFHCVDPFFGMEVDPQDCQFGPVFKGPFPDGKIDNENLNIAYLSGDYLTGSMGYGNITVANITVPKQQFALVDVAAFSGDQISSGILGLGLRGLTAAFTGNDPSNDSISNMLNYAPLMETMGTSKAASPVLSFAMSRDNDRSFIAFGGVPPVKAGEYTTVPIEKGTLNTGKEDYYYYDIKIDAISWSSTTTNKSVSDLPNMLVDSGTTINLFPSDIATAINAAYSPPGQQETTEVWTVPCNATPPVLDIVIGGKPVRTHSTSMILPETEDGGSGRCISGIGAGQPGSFILGDTLMQEIVAVFDVSEKMELKFAQRLD